MTIPPDDLARDEATIAAATEGPWWVNEYYKHLDDYAGSTDTYGDVVRSNSRYVESQNGCVCSTGIKTRNVEFIAAARTRWPLYVAAYKEAVAENERLRKREAELLAHNARLVEWCNSGRWPLTFLNPDEEILKAHEEWNKP